MRTPYFLERWRIAKAQSEDRRDFEDIVQQEEGESNGDEADDTSEVEQVQSEFETGERG